jgi:hypothetical protein
MKKVYRTVAISCKAKDLLDRIADTYAVNRGMFIEKLIEKAYKDMVEKEN